MFQRRALHLPVLLSTILLWLVSATRADAHVMNSSYGAISITDSNVICSFTYDISTLQKITPIDTNDDGMISREELHAAIPVIVQFLRDHIDLEINQRAAEFGDVDLPSWSEDAGNSIPQSDYGQRLVTFTFHNPVITMPEDVTITYDFFEQFGSTHTVLGSFRCRGRDDDIVFTRFEPDYLYDTGYVAPPMEQIKQYFKLGVKHIFLGYDHIAFLLALIFVKRFWDLLKIITAFTIAHTLTLALAVLQIVSVKPQYAEIGIALTIMFVAAENLWTTNTSHRWKLAFCFGLIHGFGFANVLRELGLPSTGLARALFSFNLGVETGQVIIVSALWPLLWWISQKSWASKAQITVSILIFLFGAAWATDRITGWNFMPF